MSEFTSPGGEWGILRKILLPRPVIAAEPETARWT